MTNKTTDNGVGNAIVVADGVGCQYCRQAIALNLPLPVHMAATILRAFADLHQFCHLRQVFTPDVMVGGEVASKGEGEVTE